MNAVRRFFARLLGRPHVRARIPCCHYCERPAQHTLVWLKDKRGMPAHVKLPWCGCHLQVALRRFWFMPHELYEGFDYEVHPLEIS